MKTELFSLIAFSFLVSSVESSSSSHQERHPIVSKDNIIDVQVPISNNDVAYQPEQEQEQPPGVHVNSSASEAEDFGPWSFKPVCTEYFDVLKDPLCVFTNASFSSGRGISIFTTPTIAREFATLLPFQDPAALSSRGINPPPKLSRPWYTKPIPGKGTGVLAKQKLQRGDLVAAYTPYLLAHMENLLSTMDREKYLRTAIEHLPEASKTHYLSLATIYGDPSVVVQDVVKANAFEMQVGGQMHLAVFPESSRINHACSPK